MQRILLSLLFSAGIVLPMAAGAQETGRVYIEGRGGVTFLPDDETSDETGFTVKEEYDTGYNVGAAVGYAGPRGLRGDIEVRYRHNDLDKFTIIEDAGFGVANGLGDLDGLDLEFDAQVSSLAAMANLYYDIDLGFPVTPFIGGGIGFANVDVEATVLGETFIDDDDTVFAYQGTAGLTYDINGSFMLSLAYQYFRTGDVKVTSTDGEPGEGEYESHNVYLGLRYAF